MPATAPLPRSACGAASAAIAIVIHPAARMSFLPLDNLYLICHAVAGGSTPFGFDGIGRINGKMTDIRALRLIASILIGFILVLSDGTAATERQRPVVVGYLAAFKGPRPVDGAYRPVRLHPLQPVLRQPRRGRKIHPRRANDVHERRDRREPVGRRAAKDGDAIAGERREGADLDRRRRDPRLLGRLEGRCSVPNGAQRRSRRSSNLPIRSTSMGSISTSKGNCSPRSTARGTIPRSSRRCPRSMKARGKLLDLRHRLL